MSAWTIIELDATAPHVTFGEPVDAIASEEMSVPYSLDEPGIDHAEFQLLDGRILPMTVGSSALTVVLPDDAPQGAGTVRVYVVDAVGNAATRSLVVAVTGVISQQPAPVGQPHPPVIEPVQIDTGRSRAATRSRYTLSVLAVTTTGRARVTSTYDEHFRVVMFGDTARIHASWTLAATAVGLSPGRAAGRDETAVQKRFEGPMAEDELILLDLL